MSDSPSSPFGVGHFIHQTDAVGALVLLALVLMSVSNWYLLLLKLWQFQRLKASSQAVRAALRKVRTPRDAQALLEREPAGEPFGRLLAQGLQACRELRSVDATRGFEMAQPDDFVSAALQHGVAGEGRALERGLSILASIGATAPFVGLFGTVWGIYHALLAVGFSGQAGLDKVAGPVGEALVMTAFGLAVAIPAVLGYNALVRLNQHALGRLERHAHWVFALLATGHAPVLAEGGQAPDAVPAFAMAPESLRGS